jgi:hypothetical protein
MTVTKNGLKYELGTAGSIVLICPKCKAVHFRDAVNYFLDTNEQTCVTCLGEVLKPNIINDDDFPGCPEGCECPSDKGCGIG